MKELSSKLNIYKYSRTYTVRTLPVKSVLWYSWAYKINYFVITSGVDTSIRWFLITTEPSSSSSSTLFIVAVAVHPVAFFAEQRYQKVDPSRDKLFFVNLKALWVKRTPSLVLFPVEINP